MVEWGWLVGWLVGAQPPPKRDNFTITTLSVESFFPGKLNLQTLNCLWEPFRHTTIDLATKSRLIFMSCVVNLFACFVPRLFIFKLRISVSRLLYIHTGACLYIVQHAHEQQRCKKIINTAPVTDNYFTRTQLVAQ